MIATFLLTALSPPLLAPNEIIARREMARSVKAAPPMPKGASAEQFRLYKVFGDYCLASNLDREKFDSLVARSSELTKVSSPFSWGGEFNRRWQLDTIELAYLDAPAPASLSCSVTMRRAAGLNPEGLQDLLGFLSAQNSSSFVQKPASLNGLLIWRAIGKRSSTSTRPTVS